MIWIPWKDLPKSPIFYNLISWESTINQNHMKPEEEARRDIDDHLKKADWDIQDRSSFNLGASPGVAIREFPTNAGPVDYALFANRKAIGVVEAKPAGSTLSGVAEQTAKYIRNFPDDIPQFYTLKNVGDENKIEQLYI